MKAIVQHTYGSTDVLVVADIPRPTSPTTRSWSACTPQAWTDREHDVLVLLAQGYNNAAIAQALFLQPKTVRNYVSSVLAKLHVDDRVEALLLAREAGLGQ